jgi:hypothetical protein
MFDVGEDGNLELLTWSPAPKYLASVYGQASYLLASPSTSGGVCSGLNPYAVSYHRAAKTTQGLPIGAHIFQPSTGISSSSASGASLDRDSTDDYPEIGGNTCWNPIEEACLIIMVAPAEEPSQNSSSRYSTIGRSKASNAQTPNDELVQNVNQDFNAVRLQIIMEPI